MKQLLLLCALFLSLNAVAQHKVQCVENTTKGTRCKNLTEDRYCTVHNPANHKCGAIKKGGNPCKMPVKVKGDRCRHHVGK